jgi:hypothetical protein
MAHSAPIRFKLFVTMKTSRKGKKTLLIKRRPVGIFRRVGELPGQTGRARHS